MAKPEQFYWDAVTSLEVHDGGDAVELSIKAYPYSGGGDPPWADVAFAEAMRPLWSVLEQVLEVLGGQKVSVISRTRVRDFEELKEARRIVTRTGRLAERVWSGFHFDIQLAEDRHMQDGVLDLEVFLYSDKCGEAVQARIRSEKKLALEAMMAELTEPVVSLFETVCAARSPIVRLYGPEWQEESGPWYGTDRCILQAVWHDDEERVPTDLPPNLIPFPRKA